LTKPFIFDDQEIVLKDGLDFDMHPIGEGHLNQVLGLIGQQGAEE